MNKIIVHDNEYELIDNYKDAFNENDFKEKCTDYFYDYDYILGDIAYGKLRLKGFYNSTNPKVQPINNYNEKDKYLQCNCAVDCRHFVVHKT